MRALLTIGLATWIGLAACTSPPPPRWVEGGAPLTVTPARWDAGDDTIEILANGQVLENGDVIFAVDRAGRIVDEDNEPVAILLPDGHLVGTERAHLGRVGVHNASPPGATVAWLALLPNGQVLFFNREGDREPQGVWQGCRGPQHRTCTLVTHVVTLRQHEGRRSPGPSFGVGVGVGF